MLLHADANGDGHIDYKGEIEGGGGVEGMLLQADANGNGNINYKGEIEGVR